MSENLHSIAHAAIHSARQPAPLFDVADAVFRAMHGFYGQLWLSKFATGELDDKGSDKGVLGAKTMWAHGLRGFDAGVVKAALRQCLERHPEYPPNLPQFVALCKANAPREVFKPALQMSGDLIAERNKDAREKLRRMREEFQSSQAKAPGLPLLFAAIADAVKCGGGDEAAALRRLESMVKS